jgi:large subunit ribosomal protein L7Ae
MANTKNEVNKEVADKALEAVRLARQTGSIRKGSNETTKSIERGLASLVVIANDVVPAEVVMHLPMLCDQRKVPYLYVSAKLDLGKAVGLNVPCTAVAIEKAGESEKLIKEITGKVTGKSADAPKAAQPAKKEEAHAKKEAAQPKKEANKEDGEKTE